MLPFLLAAAISRVGCSDTNVCSGLLGRASFCLSCKRRLSDWKQIRGTGGWPQLVGFNDPFPQLPSCHKQLNDSQGAQRFPAAGPGQRSVR